MGGEALTHRILVTVFADGVVISLNRFSLTLSGESLVQRISVNHLQEVCVECDFSMIKQNKTKKQGRIFDKYEH